jgi:hypothetical protein
MWQVVGRSSLSHDRQFNLACGMWFFLDTVISMHYNTDKESNQMSKTTQFIFRIEIKDRRLVERAAKLERRTVSDFIRLAAIDKAAEVIERDKNKKKYV